MSARLLEAISELLDDLVWYHLIWDDHWSWRRLLVVLGLAAILGAISYYLWDSR